jgi:DNA invertase Pin-like site-specific DNA recombinase
MTAHRGKFFSYLRVSTDKQGERGYGLEAQRKAITDYLNGGSWELLGEFVEVESGRRSDNRPELAKALAACKRHRAKLVIAKLDRLSRNVAFIATLMDGKVDFVCCDFPSANRLTLHILAAVAEHEREMISDRTKAGLATAKARGVQLGNRRNLAEAQAQGARGNKASADAFAARVLPVIRDIQKSGATSLRAIAAALAARGLPTARGGEWTPVQVGAVLRRCS